MLPGFTLLFFLAALVACGVAGPPVPPTAKIPVVPTGLAANQVGERVVLRWTVGRLYTDGTRMEGWPRLEIYRAFLAEAPDEEKFAAAAKVVYVLPERVVESFRRNDIVIFPDPLGAAALGQQAGRTAVYAVKAVNAKRQDAGFSNLAAVRLYPVAAPIGRIETRVTERALELRWAAPQRTTSSTPLEAIAGYQIYRSEASAEGPFALRGTAPTTVYEDTDFQFGRKYWYRIRTLAQFGADTVESDNSAAAEVDARDVFPPPAPAHVIIIAGAGRADLTWDASPAADLVGYHIYRSREPGRGYERLTKELLRAQSFADTGLPAGVTFYYVVTAVDAEGNESPHSEEVSATPLPPEQPQP